MWHAVHWSWVGKALREQRQQLHTFLQWASCCDVLMEKCISQNIFSLIWACLEKQWIPTLWLSFINPPFAPLPSLSCLCLSLRQCLVGALALFQIISLSAAILQSDRAAALKRQNNKLTQLGVSCLRSGLHPLQLVLYGRPKDLWERTSAASHHCRLLHMKTTVCHLQWIKPVTWFHSEYLK